jgi:hypothetical protein
MARSNIGRHTSRRELLSGSDLIIAAELAPLAELRADRAAQNTSSIT